MINSDGKVGSNNIGLTVTDEVNSHVPTNLGETEETSHSNNAVSLHPTEAIAARDGIATSNNNSGESEVLLVFKRQHLDKGLRGVPVGTCSTSKVTAEEGVSYRGVPVRTLLSCSVEEVLALILTGKRDETTVAELSSELKTRARVSIYLQRSVMLLPGFLKPMQRLATSLTYAGALHATEDYAEDKLRLIAMMPQLAAMEINRALSKCNPDPDTTDKSWLDSFLSYLNTESMDLDKARKVLKAFLILHMDHGGGNLSAFTGKTVASGLANQFEAMSAAITALGTPKHGRANQDSLRFVKEVYEQLGCDFERDQLKELIGRRLENKQLIPGYGHAVLRVEDPRATAFFEIGEELFSEDSLVQTALRMRAMIPGILTELKPRISNPYPNVDAMSGVLLHAIGITDPEVYPVLFGLSRSVGITQQIEEERARRVPIMRPRYLYETEDR